LKASKTFPVPEAFLEVAFKYECISEKIKNVFISNKTLAKMAFGLWQKIKNGVKRVIGGIGKGVSFVYNKVLKPAVGFVKPIAGMVTPLIDKVIPGAGSIINTGLEFLSPSQDTNAIQQEVPQEYSQQNMIYQPQLYSPGTAVPPSQNLVPRLKGTVGANGHGIRRILQ
jgi:phage-related protein